MRLDGSETGRRNARRLRRQMTPPEIELWCALRANGAGLRFRKQHAADDYVLDFYCAPARLVIEVDGEAHARGDRPARDAVRDAWLRSKGLRVIRYSARDVLSNLEGVVQQIVLIACRQRDRLRRSLPSSPSVALRAPPPPGGGGNL